MAVHGRRASRPRARTVSAVVGALTIATFVPSSAFAATAGARDLDSACPPDRVPVSGFVDISASTLRREIECIVGYEIASGVDRTHYEPSGRVTRAQMATFLAHVLEAAGRNRPANLPDAFADDYASNHEGNIDWLAAEDIVGGFADGTYRPAATVTRAQMATFLRNTLRELTGQAYTSADDYFTDDQRSPHESAIDGLAAAGVVTGTGGSSYTPAGLVTRAQMAGFLAREIDLLVDANVVRVPFAPRTITVTPTGLLALNTSDNASNNTGDRGRRSYTATVPLGVTRVNLALFPAASVTVVSGTPRFSSNAVLPANAGTSIEVVEGRIIDLAGGNTDVTQVNNLEVVAGQLRFTIDSIAVAQAVPVVWVDSANPSARRLDLEAGATTTAPKSALESVGVGGATSWGPPELTRNTNLGIVTVREVNAAAGWYTVDTGGSNAPEWLLRYGPGDTFSYTASNEPTTGSPGPIARSQFDSWLSAGDRIDPTAYDPGRMSHRMTGDVPAAPTGVVTVLQDDGKVKVAFVKPTNPVADDAVSSFRLRRAPMTGGTVGAFAEVAARTANLAPEFIDSPPTTGTFAYQIVARSVTGDSPASTTVQVAVSAPPPATTASSYVDTNASGGTGANGLLDMGDRLVFTFDRPVTVAGGWTLTLLDGDGSIGVVGGPGRTDAASLTGTTSNVLTVVLNAPPTLTSSGANDRFDIPTSGFLQVIGVSGIGNASGVWNLPRSGLQATYNNSRTVINRAATPAAPGGHILASATTRKVEFGRDEVVAIGPSNATGGTWTATFGGQTTGDLPHDIGSAQLQTKLQEMTSIGAGNVLVSGTSLATGFTLHFVGGLGGVDVGPVTVAGSELKVGDATATAPSVTVTVAGAAVAGITTGDKVTLYNTSGNAVAPTLTAGSNGRLTVTLSVNVVNGQHLYAVVEQGAPAARRSLTQTIIVGA